MANLSDFFNLIFGISAVLLAAFTAIKALYGFENVLWKFRVRDLERSRELKQRAEDCEITKLAFSEKAQQDLAGLVSGKNLNKMEREQLFKWLASGKVTFRSLQMLGGLVTVHEDREPDVKNNFFIRILAWATTGFMIFFVVVAIVSISLPLVAPKSVTQLQAYAMAAMSLGYMGMFLYMGRPFSHAVYLNKKLRQPVKKTVEVQPDGATA